MLSRISFGTMSIGMFDSVGDVTVLDLDECILLVSLPLPTRCNKILIVAVVRGILSWRGNTIALRSS